MSSLKESYIFMPHFYISRIFFALKVVLRVNLWWLFLYENLTLKIASLNLEKFFSLMRATRLPPRRLPPQRMPPDITGAPCNIGSYRVITLPGEG